LERHTLKKNIEKSRKTCFVLLPGVWRTHNTDCLIEGSRDIWDSDADADNHRPDQKHSSSDINSPPSLHTQSGFVDVVVVVDNKHQQKNIIVSIYGSMNEAKCINAICNLRYDHFVGTTTCEYEQCW
jgi:hypothetical protein